MDRFLDSADREKQTRAKAIQVDLTATRDHIQRLTKDKVRADQTAIIWHSLIHDQARAVRSCPGCNCRVSLNTGYYSAT